MLSDPQDYLSQSEVDALLRGVGMPLPVVRLLDNGTVIIIAYQIRDNVIIYLQELGYVDGVDFKLINGMNIFECSDEVKTMLMLKYDGQMI